MGDGTASESFYKEGYCKGHPQNPKPLTLPWMDKLRELEKATQERLPSRTASDLDGVYHSLEIYSTAWAKLKDYGEEQERQLNEYWRKL